MYIDIVMLVNFAVDFLLLMGTNRLCGQPARPGKAALAAGLGGVYGGMCLLPGFAFLGNTLWRSVSLGLMALIAFGVTKNALRRAVVFVLLSMALGGVALGLGAGGFWKPVIAAGGVLLLCAVGFRGNVGVRSFVPVELFYGDKSIRLTALRDTGNELRDPITGKSVVVICADAAGKLTGLTLQQLRNPIESMGVMPGLRLIPYRSVGKDCGFLLAMKLSKVKIGLRQGSEVVAFAPEGFSSEGDYQALIGGAA